jgi:dTDP-4-amino-4,6-dideoxygalactose transaminase
LFAGTPYFEHAPGEDVSRALFEAGVCLPSGSNMSDADLERVIDLLLRALDRDQADRGRAAA